MGRGRGFHRSTISTTGPVTLCLPRYTFMQIAFQTISSSIADWDHASKGSKRQGLRNIHLTVHTRSCLVTTAAIHPCYLADIKAFSTTKTPALNTLCVQGPYTSKGSVWIHLA